MKIRVTNLDPSSTEDDLHALFSEIGEVEYVEFNEEPDPEVDTYSAIVSMIYDFEAEEAISELNGEWFDGKQIVVRPSSQQQHTPRQIDPQSLIDEDEFEDENYQPIKRKKPRQGGDGDRPPHARRSR